MTDEFNHLIDQFAANSESIEGNIASLHKKFDEFKEHFDKTNQESTDKIISFHNEKIELLNNQIESFKMKSFLWKIK